MNLLAVDTTGAALSLALSAGGKIFALHRVSKKPHDETILPAVDSLLKKAGLSIMRLDAFAAASGPGRFTGIRIGMSFAAVAAGRLKKPALAVSRLEAAAFAAHLNGRFVVVLPGFREERFYQVYHAKPGKPPKAEAGPIWVSPQAWVEAERGFLAAGAPIMDSDPGARALIAPALERLKRRARAPFEPLYLKPAGYERSVR